MDCDFSQGNENQRVAEQNLYIPRERGWRTRDSTSSALRILNKINHAREHGMMQSNIKFKLAIMDVILSSDSSAANTHWLEARHDDVRRSSFAKLMQTFLRSTRAIDRSNKIGPSYGSKSWPSVSGHAGDSRRAGCSCLHRWTSVVCQRNCGFWMWQPLNHAANAPCPSSALALSLDWFIVSWAHMKSSIISFQMISLNHSKPKRVVEFCARHQHISKVWGIPLSPMWSSERNAKVEIGRRHVF